ncbi:MAG: NUDIX hydrolase [Actinomycetota bacterium]
MADEPESSEVAFEGAVFTVAREAWPGAGHPYDVVRHPGAAGVLPVTPDGDVVLVRQFRPPIRRSIVEIPAGLLDVDGEDALTCAARELEEETGYRHMAIEFLGGVYATAGSSNEYVHLFWALTEPDPAAEPEAGIELVRRPLTEMVMAARAGRVRDAKTALALLMADGRPPPRP